MSRLLAAITLPLSIALTILVTIICSVPIIVAGLIKRKRPTRTVLTGMCYSVGSATRQGSSSLTRLTGQSAMTSRTWLR
ncbi:hypothetical protein CWN18_03210 [Klebsiella pneumoniae]|nr:hypothetical protein CWN18_03210 [Klebsiella pneumoniae]